MKLYSIEMHLFRHLLSSTLHHLDQEICMNFLQNPSINEHLTFIHTDAEKLYRRRENSNETHQFKDDKIYLETVQLICLKTDFLIILLFGKETLSFANLLFVLRFSPTFWAFAVSLSRSSLSFVCFTSCLFRSELYYLLTFITLLPSSPLPFNKIAFCWHPLPLYCLFFLSFAAA